MTKHEEVKNAGVFPLGEENLQFQKFFTGKSYLKMLVTEPESSCVIANVTFEPGCRNNWHKHKEGQILLVTGGVGWYQEEGKAARKLESGDVVNIPPDVRHWHGAAPDSWFSHLAMTVNPQTEGTTWLEPVTEEEYRKISE